MSFYTSLLILWLAAPCETDESLPQSDEDTIPAKVLLVYDMEGLTGVTDRGVSIGSDRYGIARESLRADVNAAIKGLLQAGADEVVLVDGHGSGNPEPDYPLEFLPERARHEIREEPYDPYLAVLDSDYVAVVAIGMHVGSGDDGFMAHTVLPHTRWVANGFAMNESMIVAAFAGQSEIPLVLVTGDDGLKDEVERFSPKTKYVTVKTAISYRSAEARPRATVSREIEMAAANAFRERESIPPWRSLHDRAVSNEFGYRTHGQMELASLYPNAVLLNNKTVGLRTDDLLAGYLAYRALASYTILEQYSWIVETIQDFEDGDEIIQRVGEKMTLAEMSFEPTESELEFSIFSTHGSK